MCDKKLELINRKDRYEMPSEAWKDNMNLWQGMTYVHVGMYLVFQPSPHNGEDLINYMGLECYQHFTAGWVREIIVMLKGEKDF